MYILLICLLIGIIITAILYVKQKAENRKLLSQKKRSEVNLGFISEKLAPFLEGFEYDPKSMVFIGKPIDYIHFGNDKITFVEVKSGNSRLSKGQKRIKAMIKNNKIDWYEFRVSNKGGDTNAS